MNPRFALIAGAALSAGVALVLAFAPAAWLAGLIGVTDGEATGFLLRRYGASATAAIAVTSATIAMGGTPQRAALLGFAAWFGVQAMVAIGAVLTGIAGGLIWLAVVADPLIGAWFLLLSWRTGDRAQPRRPGPVASTGAGRHS